MRTKNGMDLRGVLETIHKETAPIYGHPNPGAIADLWDEVYDTIDAYDEQQKTGRRAG